MADVHSKETRSYNMSRIRGKNTKPELLLRKAFWAAGVRFRIHDKSLPGKPDIVIKKYKLAIFVDGENSGCQKLKVILPGTKGTAKRWQYWAAPFSVFGEKMSGRTYFQCVNQIMLYIETARSGSN